MPAGRGEQWLPSHRILTERVCSAFRAVLHLKPLHVATDACVDTWHGDTGQMDTAPSTDAMHIRQASLVLEGTEPEDLGRLETGPWVPGLWAISQHLQRQTRHQGTVRVRSLRRGAVLQASAPSSSKQSLGNSEDDMGIWACIDYHVLREGVGASVLLEPILRFSRNF